MKKLNIALVQMTCGKGDIEGNLNIMEKYIKESKERTADIICFPEMNITGYMNPLKCPEKVLNIHSDAVRQIIKWSKIYNIVIIAGFIEKNLGRKPFITQIAARYGEIVCQYRKKTVVDKEAEWFSKGDELSSFSCLGINIGLAICADIEDEDIFREYRKSGVQLIFESAAPGLYGDQSTRDWQNCYKWWKSECYNKLGRYAGENQIFIAVSTQSGRTIDEDFPGGGYIFSPTGDCINETADWHEGILYETLFLS